MNNNDLNINNEFDVESHLKLLYKNKYFILGCIIIFLVLGVSYYFLSERNYNVKIIVMPETAGSSPPSLAGVASLAGINLNNNPVYDNIPSGLYPTIVYSPPFLERLSEVKVKTEDMTEPLTYREYHTEYNKASLIDRLYKYTIGLPNILMELVFSEGSVNAISSITEYEKLINNIKSYTKQERAIMAELMESIDIKIDKEFGYIEIISSTPQPDLSAQIGEQTVSLLQEFVHEFRTKKAASELNFLQDRYDIKRHEYDSVQDELANFRDRNLVISTEKAKIDLERLQNEFTLQAAILQELAKNLETQKLELAKQSPSFSIIQPPIIPLSPERPSKILVIFLSIILGLIFSVGIIYTKIESKKVYLYIKRVVNT